MSFKHADLQKSAGQTQVSYRRPDQTPSPAAIRGQREFQSGTHAVPYPFKAKHAHRLIDQLRSSCCCERIKAAENLGSIAIAIPPKI
jgi:hypothetical protein